jgi:purine-nucleoside/S-methyl-5'-thioadenosine phosphorylase / adenosine deaminase
VARAAWCRQVHGADVLAAAGPGCAGTGDALVTRQRGQAVAIATADCVPIVLWDPDAGALGVVHAGWRGAAQGVAEAAVDALARSGARPERLRVAIGPSIGPCCYEVDGPVMEAFARAYPDRWERWFAPRRPGHAMLDLWTASEHGLHARGVDPAHVTNPRVCTGCRVDLFYSYRKGQRGRLLTLAALPGAR